MKIILTDGYYITTDNYNYILKHEYLSKEKRAAGNKQTRIVGFYSNGIGGLKGCIKRYLEECSLDAENEPETNVRTFCGHLERTVCTSTEWIISHIGNLVMALKDAEAEIERLKRELGEKNE